MTSHKAADVVPFGKYKGQPVGALVADADYCDWLLAQPWFRDRFANVYQVVVNYGAEPVETPEHNALQLSFLDDARCLRLARLFFPEMMGEKDITKVAWDDEVKYLRRFSGLFSVSSTEPAVRGRIFEDHGWDVTYLVDPGVVSAELDSYPPCSCAPCSHDKCPSYSQCQGGDSEYACVHRNCSRRATAPKERGGTDEYRCHHEGECLWSEKDVTTWFGHFSARTGGQLAISYSRGMIGVHVECKPDLGDDFPAVLRQVTKYRPRDDAHGKMVRVVVVRRHAFESVTFEQVKEMFASSGIRLVRESDLL